LLQCTVNSESINNTSDNIYHFSDDNPENREGSNSNSEDNPENNEGSNSNSENNPENNEDSNSNSEDSPDNNEGSNSNSDGDSSSDDDGPKDNDVEKVGDPEHNGPERIVDDLDKVDNAKDDPEALEYLQQEYSEFFNGRTIDQALEDIKNYLEEEFDAEHERSEWEATTEEATDRAEKDIKIAELLEQEAARTLDPVEKANLEEAAKSWRKGAEAQSKIAEEATSKANGTWKEEDENMEDASEENQPESPRDESMGSDAGENQSEDEENGSKRPLAEEEEERKTKRKKTDGSDNNDGNSSGGGGAGPSAPSGPSGPSDSGPSSSSGGGLLSKIWANFVLYLSSFFETLAEIAPNIFEIVKDML
jgi:hypothetical protein